MVKVLKYKGFSYNFLWHILQFTPYQFFFVQFYFFTLFM